MMKTSEQVRAEVQGYLIKSMGRELKIFRDAETKKAFDIWTNTWPSLRTLDSSEESPKLTSPKVKDSLHTAIDFAKENRRAKLFLWCMGYAYSQARFKTIVQLPY